MERSRVTVAWFNDPITSPYDHTILADVGYNNIRDYTVQANAARGGTRPSARARAGRRV